MKLYDEVSAIVAADGLIVRKQHPRLGGCIDRHVRAGRLRAVLPGVYAVSALADRPELRIQAVALRHPDAVLTGFAAAQVTYWPGVALDTVTAAVPTAARPQPGFRFDRRRIPPELVTEIGGLRVTIPELTAIDVATHECADAIDIALRSRAATLSGMVEALRLTSGRAGNRARTALLLDSRDEPWSAAERLAHRVLRGAGITGWRTNQPVWLDGRRYYIDIAFDRARLAIEIDGRLHQTDPLLFQTDRWRQNALTLDGWRVLRFTWLMLQDHPEALIEGVRTALR